MGIITAKWRNFFLTLDNLGLFDKIMDVRDKTHIIHSYYAAGWEK